MNMNIKHMGLDMINEFFKESKQSLGAAQCLSMENNKRFLEMRIKFLDSYLDQLEEQERKLEKELMDEIQQIIADKGAELLSIKQIKTLAAKECGVCEADLESLKEELENKDLGKEVV